MDPSTGPSLTVELHGSPYWSLRPFLPGVVLAILLVLLLALVWWSYRRTPRPIGPGRLLALTALRLLAALAVWTALLCPVQVQDARWRQKGLCFLVVDASSSMNVCDAPRNATRWAFARDLLASHPEELRRLDEQYEVRRFLFDAEPREVPRLPGEAGGDASEKATGRATDLAALLERIGEESVGAPCAGVLLLSDGRHNRPADPVPCAVRLREADVPLFVVGLGHETAPSDYCEVNLRWLDVPERTFVNAEVTIGIDIDAQLPFAMPVPLTVTVNDEKIFDESVELPAGLSSRRVNVKYVPTAVGFHRVQVVARPLPTEASVENNRQTAYFRVLRSRLAIWYVEGSLRKEFGAIRAALSTAPNMTLRAFNAFVAMPEQGDAELLPQSEDVWSDTRLFIIGDLSADRFTPAQLRRLAVRVEDGGAVLMLGGGSTLGSGRWDRSPLAEVLPVELSRSPGLATGPFVLKSAVEQHPALRFDVVPNASSEVMRRLPTVPWLNLIDSAKPAAAVLLRGDHHPLLIVQDYGHGRSAVYTSATTWQWSVKADQQLAQQVFWRNLATWLTRSDYREADRVIFAECDRLRAKTGEEISFSVQVQSTEKVADRIDQARIQAVLETGGKTVKVWVLGRGPGTYTLQAAPQSAGSYLLRAMALGPGDEPLGTDTIEFQVDAEDLEHNTPKANLRLLQYLAQHSAGFYYDAENAGRAFERLLQRPAGYSKLVRKSEERWNHGLLFLLVVLLLGGEWLVRKKSGLP